MPKHLRTEDEVESIPRELRLHVVDLHPDFHKHALPPGPRHPAKYAGGLPTLLLDLAGTESVGDPMAGTGSFAWETGVSAALNDIDARMAVYLDPLVERGCDVTYGPAHEVPWHRECVVFSPPYYPRTDRRKPNAHDDAKRGPVVGFRDSYGIDHEDFIGNPGGVAAILTYREQMRRVYAHMMTVADRMIVVTKNWMRLGVELRLDLDTILMAQEVGWECVSRHGLEPPPSLWARYNHHRGGMVLIEDVLVFAKRAVAVVEEAESA